MSKKENTKIKNKNVFKTILIYNFVSLTIFLLFLKIYLSHKFKLASFEQLLFSITNTEGGSASPIIEGIILVSIFLILGLGLLTINIITYKKSKFKLILNFNLKNKKNKSVQLFPIKVTVLRTFIIFLIVLLYFGYGIGAYGYIENRLEESNIYEKNYVDPKDVKIKFPKKKRNLIYIFLESTENSSLSKENGGTVDNSYMSELEQLALDNLNFSNTDKIGGAYQISNTGWTIAAMIAQTSGVTLNVELDGNLYKNYSSFLPGVTSLGEILLKENYINYLMLGSDSKYGGRKEYFKKHGFYYIYDYYTALEKEKFSNYYVWWGYEDKKLFDYAKEELTTLAAGDQPFNFTLLTADTHFMDGYLDDDCDTPFDKRYANVFNCSSKKIYDFISWIKEQDFYENTTIVISGDHLTMQSNFFEDDGYDRTIYNVFINSAISTKNNKNRKFSTLDMFPTTLASLGVKIKGDRLALGTNLFSEKETLIEKYGIDYVNAEILKKSNFYNERLLKDTYYEIEEKKISGGKK